ncbi:MAG: hypothetical protein COA54_04770 [Thiotrichaceae bacterium]|nr:MAG: hypothetical protein COA54_04770 [Thiotrichaceae bacterium]
MNILYIGSSGALSLIPFKKLLVSHYQVSAVGIFNPILLDGKVIALENESLSLLANQESVQVVDLSQSIDTIVQQCKRLSIDIILMSCYGKRLPTQIVNLPTQGCYNLHPSLLPDYRGPEPVFWQMKAAATIGVSWHKVVYDFDAGDICNQKKVMPDDGASYVEINQQLAEAGAGLMLDLLADCSSNKLSVIEQDAKLSRYYSYPIKKDFVVDTQWSAQHAYDFICATAVFGHTYQCAIDGRSYGLVEAFDYDNNANLDCVERQGDRLYIPFKEGVLVARYADTINL